MTDDDMKETVELPEEPPKPKKRRGRPPKGPEYNINKLPMTKAERDALDEVHRLEVKTENVDNLEDLKAATQNFCESVIDLMLKFETQYGVKLRYIPKFYAFKIVQGDRHVDWIHLNELVKRYDVRMPPISHSHPAVQRPQPSKRIW